MSTHGDRPDPAELVGELTRTLRSLRHELRTSDRPRGGLDRMLRFTTDVTIPATILLLETNIRALRILQRALRLADDPQRDRDQRTVSSVGRTVVDGVDEALSEARSAVEEAADDEGVSELLSEARRLNRQLDERLDDLPDDEGESTASVDVDAELASLKDEVDDGNDEDG